MTAFDNAVPTKLRRTAIQHMTKRTRNSLNCPDTLYSLAQFSSNSCKVSSSAELRATTKQLEAAFAKRHCVDWFHKSWVLLVLGLSPVFAHAAARCNVEGNLIACPLTSILSSPHLRRQKHLQGISQMIHHVITLYVLLAAAGSESEGS